MPATNRARLTWHLREGLEQWLGETISGGPYEDLIDVVATAIDRAELTLPEAARLARILSATAGKEPPACETCDCPIPGASHPVHGGCPDLRLHERSPDGKCRYCRE